MGVLSQYELVQNGSLHGSLLMPSNFLRQNKQDAIAAIFFEREYSADVVCHFLRHVTFFHLHFHLPPTQIELNLEQYILLFGSRMESRCLCLCPHEFIFVLIWLSYSQLQSPTQLQILLIGFFYSIYDLGESFDAAFICWSGTAGTSLRMKCTLLQLSFKSMLFLLFFQGLPACVIGFLVQSLDQLGLHFPGQGLPSSIVYLLTFFTKNFICALSAGGMGKHRLKGRRVIRWLMALLCVLRDPVQGIHVIFVIIGTLVVVLAGLIAANHAHSIEPEAIGQHITQASP